jgi:hypothetical protein
MSRTLRRIEESPSGEAFWEGYWRVVVAGEEDRVRYFLVCHEDAAPTPEQIAFCDQIGEELASCQDAARAFLANAIVAEPRQYGLEEAEAEALCRRIAASLDGLGLAPFGGAEATFYGAEEWFLRFTETPLPACSMLGVGIDFVGVRPVGVRCLDRDAAVEPVASTGFGRREGKGET